MKIEIRKLEKNPERYIQEVLKARGIDLKKIIEKYKKEFYELKNSKEKIPSSRYIDLGGFLIYYDAQKKKVGSFSANIDNKNYVIIFKKPKKNIFSQLLKSSKKVVPCPSYEGIYFAEYSKKFNVKYNPRGILREVEFDSYSSETRHLNITIAPNFKENKLESSVHEDYFERVNQRPKKEIPISGDSFSIYDFFKGKPILKDSKSELKYDADKVPLKLEEIKV